MAWVSEYLDKRHQAQDVLFGRVRERGLRHVGLECNCGARLVFSGRVAVRYSEQDHLECGVCGERFVLARMVTHRDHALSEHREARSPTSTLYLRQHIKRFLAIASISLALVAGTSALAFAASRTP
ncbi:MAG: hypothetical protein M3N18_00490 [Actinomycetota bacterium]|nr:hypothetical protein [Actinomycetota bacterium]